MIGHFKSVVVLAGLGFTLSGLTVTAQAPAPKPPIFPPTPISEDKTSWENRIFQVKHADMDALISVFRLFRGEFIAEPRLGVLSVRAPKEILPAIEDAIKRLDVPSAPLKQAELTIYVIKATEQPSPATIPAILQPVVNQLRGLFSYRGFELNDTLVVRGTDGRSSTTSGLLPGLNRFSERGTSYTFAARFLIRPTDPKPRVLYLEQMTFGIDVEVDTMRNSRRFQISNDVDVPFGQQVVVGKTNAGDATALILVMTARLIE